MKRGRIIIISAPSGCGKSTIIKAIMNRGNVDMQFSVSATNRSPREGEENGVSYHFLTDEEFRRAIADDAFIEFEEVYPGRFYGTLKSEVRQRLDDGVNVVLDIDVKGGVRVKKMFGSDALAIFIMPPSVEELRRRLESRATDSQEQIDQRVSKAEYEIGFAPQYDVRIVNDNLEETVDQTEKIIMDFLNK
ncbi:MAG: guanylate kinase [Bacteroides sp.]|nr:guanylate kinase [Bacteroides sp.]MCM1413369.1 guanylate kinase [Bacteroides sp.]MCM1471945.1 guanylate kinase [Bacteroides sp.]